MLAGGWWLVLAGGWWLVLAGGWWLVLAGGLLWPEVTILVLSVLLGEDPATGVIEIVFALSLWRLHGELQAR